MVTVRGTSRGQCCWKRFARRSCCVRDTGALFPLLHWPASGQDLILLARCVVLCWVMTPCSLVAWYPVRERVAAGASNTFLQAVPDRASAPHSVFSSLAGFSSVTISFLSLCSSLFASPNILSGPHNTTRVQHGRTHVVALFVRRAGRLD